MQIIYIKVYDFKTLITNYTGNLMTIINLFEVILDLLCFVVLIWLIVIIIFKDITIVFLKMRPK